ncbi:MAG: hypothetical protein ACRYFB_11650 [Janthinobacterium lividum]
MPTGLVSTIAGNGNRGFLNGTGASATFNNPCDIAVDATGNIYVSDQWNVRIRKITPSGAVSTLTRNGSYGSTGWCLTQVFHRPII